MADASTTRYGFIKPEVGASADTWGGKWNANNDDYDVLLGVITTTGSANAYVLTTGLSLAAYVSGQSFLIKASFGNTSTATINVDGLGAKALTKNGTTALASGDIASGTIYRVSYDGTQFQVMNAYAGVFQPLDATLTALAALSWSSLTPVLQFTAADTVSLTSTPKVTTVELGDATDTTLARVSAGVASIEGKTLGMLSQAQTWSAQQNYSNSVYAGQFNENCFLVLGSGSNRKALLGSNGGTVNMHAYSTTDTFESTWLALNLQTGFFDWAGTMRARPPTSAEASGTLTSASANKKVFASGNITIDGNVFTAGDDIWIYAGASSRTLTQGSTGSPTQRLHGTATTGNLTLSARGVAVVSIISATEWVISGDVA